MSASSPAAGGGRGRAIILVLLLAGAAAGTWLVMGRGPDRRQVLEMVQQGRWKEAEPLLRRLVEKRPEDREVLRSLCEATARLGKVENLGPLLEQWRRLDPTDAEPLRIGMVHYRAGKDEARELEYARALAALHPDDLDVQRRIAQLQFLARDLEAAEATCRALLKQEPNDRGTVPLLAQILRDTDRLQEAAAVLDRLLAEHPDHHPSLMARGIYHYELGEAAKAVPLLRRVAREDPTRTRVALYHLSVALARSGKKEEAEQVLAEVRKIQAAQILEEDYRAAPDNLDLQVKTARAFRDVGKLKEALDVLRPVVERHPGFRPAHALLAELYDEQKDAVRAAQHRKLAGE